MTNSLILKTTDHPATAGAEVEVFRDAETACAHMRDHLLSCPECFGWGLLDPNYSSVFDLDNPDSRWRYVREMMRSEGEVAQGLYDIYFQIINSELRDANLLNWYATEGDVTVALGTGGVLIVIRGRQIKTAFLPGLGSAEATKRARKNPSGKSDSLLRESGGETSRRGRAGKGKSRDRKQRESLWTPEQSLYFKVFKPAVKFIRKSHCGKGKRRPAGSHQQYGLLKECLPKMKKLGFESWLKLRKGLRAGRRGQS